MPTQEQIDDATLIDVENPSAVIDFSRLGNGHWPAVSVELDPSGVPFIRIPLPDGTSAETSVDAFRLLLDAQVSPRWRLAGGAAAQEIRACLLPIAGGCTITVARLIAGPLKPSETIGYLDGSPRNLRPDNLVIRWGAGEESLEARKGRWKLH